MKIIIAACIGLYGFFAYTLCRASGLSSKEEETWDSDYILGINKNEENKS